MVESGRKPTTICHPDKTVRHIRMTVVSCDLAKIHLHPQRADAELFQRGGLRLALIAKSDEIPEEARPLVLSAMATVATHSGARECLPITRRLIEAAGEHLFELPPDAISWDPITPDNLTEALSEEDQRAFALELMSLIPLADKQEDGKEISTLDAFAYAAGVKPVAVADIDRLGDEKYNLLIFDMGRRLTSAAMGTDSRWEIFHQTMREMRLRAHENKPLANKYLELEGYPDGTLGHTFFHFYQDRKFLFPGQKHSLGEVVTRHDTLHILSGCNTDGTGEINVSGVEAGMIKGGTSSEFLVQTLQFFQTGIGFGKPVSGGYAIKSDELDPETLMRKIRLGMDMTGSVFDPKWDWWSAVDQSVEELRQEFGIVGVEGALIPPPAVPATSPDDTD